MKRNVSGDAILVFSNSWCAQCYTEKKVVEDFSKNILHQGLIVELNEEENPEMFKKYHVHSAPTTIVIKEGKVVAEARHYLDLDQLTRIAEYYFKEKMMTEKKKTEEQKPKFEIVNDNNLSAGICGPDGCVLDWDKAKDK